MVKAFLKSNWQLMIGLTLALAGVAWTAWGGEYNFYFNNTEQGDGSTASPTVTVQGGVPSKTPAVAAAKPTEEKAAAAPAGTPLPAPAVASGPSGFTAAYAPKPESEQPIGVKHFWISGEAVEVRPDAHASYNARGGASLGVRFTREIGISSFVVPNVDLEHRLVVGAELEIIPVHVTFGRINDLLDVGVLAGASGLYDGTSNVWAAPHAGLRADVNLGENWGITTAARVSDRLAMAEAGLAIRI